MDRADRAHGCQEYLCALEEEQRKIEVFRRELPLCLQLVTQTIEGIRREIDGMGRSEDTVSDDRPVLEEFIPLKPNLSSPSSEEESIHAATQKEAASDASPEKKPDWLQSVQLWNQEPRMSKKDLPCKPVAVNMGKAGGAFQPFEKERRVEQPVSSTGAASSVVGGSSEKETEKEKDKEKGKEGQSQPHRKARRCWAPELHRRFLQALQQLGGCHVATPKQIRELMKVDGLTNDEVKSHLQKYRLHTRRPSSTARSSSGTSTPAPQFVVVGSIWVPPPDYAAAAAAVVAAAQPQAQPASNASGNANSIYAPVATLPSGALRTRPQAQPHQQQNKRCSEGRRSSDDDDDSVSAAVSSSSQTTTASPA